MLSEIVIYSEIVIHFHLPETDLILSWCTAGVFPENDNELPRGMFRLSCFSGFLPEQLPEDKSSQGTAEKDLPRERHGEVHCGCLQPYTDESGLMKIFE